MYRWTAGPLAVLSVVVCLGAIGAVSAAEPSLNLEGKGTFSFLDACSQTSCPAVLNATLNGDPFGQTELHLPIAISTAANEFTGCRSVIGRGGRLSQGQRVTFSGEICDPPIKGLSALPSHTPFPPPSPQRMRFPGHSISGSI